MVITNSNLDSSLFTVELSQVAERESVRRGSLKALRDRWEDLSRLCRVCLLDGHTLRLTPPAGVTSSTDFIGGTTALEVPLEGNGKSLCSLRIRISDALKWLAGQFRAGDADMEPYATPS